MHRDICELDALLTFAVRVVECYGSSRQYSGGGVGSIVSTAVRNLGAFSGQFATVGLQLLSLTLCVLLLKQILPLCVEDVNTAGLLRVCTRQCSDSITPHRFLVNDCAVLYVDAARNLTLGRPARMVDAASLTECHGHRNARTVVMLEWMTGFLKKYLQVFIVVGFHFRATAINSEEDGTMS